jgi:hypothetical protein
MGVTARLDFPPTPPFDSAGSAKPRFPWRGFVFGVPNARDPASAGPPMSLLDSLGSARYHRAMAPRTLPAGFIGPCLPIKAPKPPSGELWLHEIKHDGLRVIARKTGEQVRLYCRPGNDFTHRFPLIVQTVVKLRSRSCIIDGEAVICDDKGIACFDRIRRWDSNGEAFLYAFDLIEPNGEDLRREPLEVRRRRSNQCWPSQVQASATTSTSQPRGRSSSPTPASLGLKASSRSGRTRAIGRAAHRIGSSSRILHAPP